MSDGPTIDEVRVASPADRWSRCGFAVEDGVAAVGTVRIRLVGGSGGITGWTLRGARATEIDGLPTVPSQRDAPPPGSHPLGALRIDHLVVVTTRLGRTVASLEAAGARLRRVREPDEPGPPLRQAFFRLGEVILELAEDPRAPQEAPARFWGITVCVADLDACAEQLGGLLGEVHDAVQPGRRIATVRGEAGLGTPVALISPGG